MCLDSCHLLASGYEIRTVEGLDETLADCDRTVGLERLHSIHLNDSLTPLGSNRDRHAAPGEGEIGKDGLAVFLSEPRFQDLPVVLETGTADGAVAAVDIELAHELRERGQAQRGRPEQGRRSAPDREQVGLRTCLPPKQPMRWWSSGSPATWRER